MMAKVTRTSVKKDTAMDKRMGIKPGSKADQRMDKKMGVRGEPKGK
jgi:hypothetical protein